MTKNRQTHGRTVRVGRSAFGPQFGLITRGAQDPWIYQRVCIKTFGFHLSIAVPLCIIHTSQYVLAMRDRATRTKQPVWKKRCYEIRPFFTEKSHQGAKQDFNLPGDMQFVGRKLKAWHFFFDFTVQATGIAALHACFFHVHLSHCTENYTRNKLICIFLLFSKKVERSPAFSKERGEGW